MTAVLPATGRVIVDTLTDTYDLDLDARIAIKTGLSVDAVGGLGEPEVFLFDDVELDDAFLLFDALDPDGFPRPGEYVIGVTPHAEVTA